MARTGACAGAGRSGADRDEWCPHVGVGVWAHAGCGGAGRAASPWCVASCRAAAELGAQCRVGVEDAPTGRSVTDPPPRHAPLPRSPRQRALPQRARRERTPSRLCRSCRSAFGGQRRGGLPARGWPPANSAQSQAATLQPRPQTRPRGVREPGPRRRVRPRRGRRAPVRWAASASLSQTPNAGRNMPHRGAGTALPFHFERARYEFGPYRVEGEGRPPPAAELSSGVGRSAREGVDAKRGRVELRVRPGTQNLTTTVVLSAPEAGISRVTSGLAPTGGWGADSGPRE